ncbi:NBS-LRR resistance protein, partial [Trifolium pratense]
MSFFTSSSKRKSDNASMEEETSQLQDDKFISWVSSTYPKHKSGAIYTESLNSRVQDVIQILKQSKCPLLLGIWGMPGIGKTTIADAIYDQIAPYFEDTCFLKNVRSLVKYETLVYLQEKFLFDIDKATEINISTIESGKLILKERLQGKRVLLVLDDVDKLEQLNALYGSLEWFGEGSKIIITTRDRKLLKEHGVVHIYKMKELDESDSFELFNLKAFNKATPPEGYAQLSRQVFAYSGGLPLALGEIGTFLFGRTVNACKSYLEKLKVIPKNNVQRLLEDSFNDLSGKEKQIFLDIAYLFIGRNQDDVLQALNRSTPSAALQISLLKDKCFLTIDENNNLQVHVLLQA